MKLTCLISLLLLPIFGLCQNLIANGGFEEDNYCTEFNAKCAPEAWFRLPPTELNVSTKKLDAVFNGEYSELIGVENRKIPINYRVFLYTKLLHPLEGGEQYKLSFYFNPIHHKAYQLGILFSSGIEIP